MSNDKRDTNNPGKNEARRLIAVLGRNNVVLIAFGSLILAFVLGCGAMLVPGLFLSTRAQPILCFFLTLFTAVFMFALYPADYRFPLGKLAEIPVVLVGPVALWIALFMILLRTIPVQSASIETAFTFPDDLSISVRQYLVVQRVRLNETTWKPYAPAEVYQLLDSKNDVVGYYLKSNDSSQNYGVELDLGDDKNRPDQEFQAIFKNDSSVIELRGTK